MVPRCYRSVPNCRKEGLGIFDRITRELRNHGEKGVQNNRGVPWEVEELVIFNFMLSLVFLFL